jgi:hypothetical protein
MLQFCSLFICAFIFQRCRFVGRGRVSGRIKRRDTNALRLQSFIYVCGAHGPPRLRGEWIRMEGNKFILFPSRLTAVREVLHENVKWKLVCNFTEQEKSAKKLPFSAGGERLSPLATAATVWSIVPTPDDRCWWLWSNRWNASCQGKPMYSKKTYPSDTLSTTNPTWPVLGSNPGRRCGKPATNRLSYGTALYSADTKGAASLGYRLHVFRCFPQSFQANYGVVCK